MLLPPPKRPNAQCTSFTIALACATQSFTPRVCAPPPASSRLDARWGSGPASNAPACTGPSTAQTPSSPCAAPNSADALRTSGSAAPTGLPHDVIPQNRRAPTDAPLEGDEYISFLAERDRAYLRRMRDAIRTVTDAQVPIAGTLMGYGGMLNLETHADLDYQDNHFYIDHYHFPHTAWDSRDWRIRDASSVGTGMSSILNMAVSRAAGRPRTVSEFTQPYPNRQAAELDPVLAAFGGLPV